MNQPKISVITVSYNQGEFIKQNIESVLAQEYPNFEHLIIDGGSTDQTLDIVRSYPHLNWVSEPDRGQSHALNKGFAKASGDIIAWLNTDDWYAPKIFHAVAAALQDKRVVLGAAEEVDRHGNSRQVVENVERSFWDLYKYWVPYAWLAQPSVFFRRDLLEEVKLGPQTYVDESLYFVMDIDLWLRMAMREPFERRIPHVCSYYRIYEDNKTGKHPLAAQRELGRLFRRYDATLCRPERPLSFVIPCRGRTPELERTIQSLISQSQPAMEILLLDQADGKDASKQLREYSFELLASHTMLSVRYARTQARDLMASLNDGISQAAGSLVCLLSPGDVVEADFCLQTTNLFLYDWLGVALVLSDNSDIKATLCLPSGAVNPNGLFTLPFRFPHLVIRKSTWIDLGGFRHLDFPALSLREFLLRASDKSWMLSADNNLAISGVPAEFSSENARAGRQHDVITAYLLSELAHERTHSAFSRLKEQQHIGLDLPAQTVAMARQLLDSAPTNWLTSLD